MLQSIRQIAQRPGVASYWTLGFLFLLGMHYFQSHPRGDGLQVSFNTFSWIPLSIVIGAGLLQIAGTAQITTSSLFRGLVLSTLVLLIPLFFPASASIIDLGRFYSIFAGLLLFLALQQLQLDERQVTVLFFWVLLAVLIQALFGWVQYAAPETTLILGVLPVGSRPYGVFRQPNVMASFLATGLVISSFLMVRLQQENRRKIYQVTCLLAPLAIVPLLVVLNSRVGWLGSLIGALLVLPYQYSQTGKRITLAWVAMFLLGFIVGLLLLEQSGGWAAAAAKLQVDPSRAFIFPQVLRMIAENPLLGVGYGNFEASYNLFAANLYASGITENAGYPNLHHPHNELLYWGAEGGIIALFALLLAAWYVLKSILRAPKGHRLVLVGLFFPIVLHTQTEYPFYHSIIHFVVFVLVIYLVDRLGNEQKTKQLSSTLLFGTAGIVIPLVTSAFMITTLHAGAVLTKYEQVQGTNVATLLKIVNPMVWRERIIWQLGSTAMFAGLAQGDNTAAYKFIEIMKDSLREKPRWEGYQNLIFAYEFVRDRDGLQEAMREAKYRFPSKEFYDSSDGELIIFRYEDTSEDEDVN